MMTMNDVLDRDLESISSQVDREAEMILSNTGFDVFNSLDELGELISDACWDRAPDVERCRLLHEAAADRWSWAYQYIIKRSPK
jgi:hypothetical protein